MSDSSEGASSTVHIAGKLLLLGADTLTTALLLHTVSVDVTIVVIELLLGAGDAFLSGTKTDVVLVIVIGCHKKFLRFRFALETEELWVLSKNGRDEKTAVLDEFLRFGLQQPAQKAAVIFSCTKPLVEPSVISRCEETL